jgi:SAM-dependent methyltransferase
MRLYEEIADWWPIFSPPEEYEVEAAGLHRLLQTAGVGPVRTLLELGCGGGHNAVHLKRHYAMTLTDVSQGMLDCSRALNPECEHILGDMRTLRLERRFDAVLVHDAVMYMTDEAQLRAAVETAYLHCCEGGVALFVPDCVRETFSERAEPGGGESGGRAVRFLEWAFDPDANDTTYRVEYAVMLRSADGDVSFVHDSHVEGLFSRGDWVRLLREVGFDVRIVADDYRDDVFVAVRRG